MIIKLFLEVQCPECETDMSHSDFMEIEHDTLNVDITLFEQRDWFCRKCGKEYTTGNIPIIDPDLSVSY